MSFEFLKDAGWNFAKPGTFKFCAIFCIMMLIWDLDDKQEQTGYDLTVVCFWVKLARGRCPGYFLLSIWHNLASPGKREPQIKNCLEQIGL